MLMRKKPDLFAIYLFFFIRFFDRQEKKFDPLMVFLINFFLNSQKIVQVIFKVSEKIKIQERST